MIKPNTKEKDLKFTPLVNEFVKFLKEREAVCAKKRVFYFRGC
jgi:hypothetical protein